MFGDLTVGSHFRSRGEIAVTAERIRSFAAEFDPQPLHLHGDAGVDPLGAIIASGWHTAAIAMRLILDSDLPLHGRALGVAVESMRWRVPVRPGDRLRLAGTIVEVRPSRSHPDRDLVKFRVTAYNQMGTPALDATHVVLVSRRGASREGE
jgi:acyl dehydratase